MFDNLTLQLSRVESLFIKVTRPHIFTIGMVYRPPKANTDDFLSFIEEAADDLVTKNHYYIMGDFNINLLRNENKAIDLVNLFYTYHHFPNVTNQLELLHKLLR